MKELKQKYIDILEENDWSVSSYTDDGRVELQKYSPAGEDFSIIVEVEDFTESVRKYAMILMRMNTQKCGLRQEVR